MSRRPSRFASIVRLAAGAVASVALGGVAFAAEGVRRRRASRVPVPAQLPPPEGGRLSTQEGFGKILAELARADSPLAERTRPLQVEPALEDYEVGLFTLEKRLTDPVIQAFWSQLR